VCCCLLLVLSAAAQVQNGQFSGTVTDPSGAAIAGAKVTATNSATNYSQTTSSNSSGAFTIKELSPGLYNLTVTAGGFRDFSNKGVTINAGNITHVDARMLVGQAKEVVEVSGEAAIVNTDDSKLASTVSATQIENLPLNGRNVYDLIQMAPGAVNVMGTDFENGHGTVVNGLREDFNGFMINGIANKDLSGGVINTPIQDTVQEFQQLEFNMSAQYGNSAGAINNLVTKSGTNEVHGSLWEYVRNDVFDANQYFLNRPGTDPVTGGGFKPALRFNQFGGTVGGPIVKDKLFFFGSYQGDRFKSVATPQTTLIESPQYAQAVISAFPNSTAALLYNNFKPRLGGSSVASTLDSFTGADYSFYLCPQQTFTPADATTANALAAKFQSFLGVTAQDVANAAAAPVPCSLSQQPSIVSLDRTAPFELNSVALFGTQTQTLGNLFNGNEASLKIDYDWNASNRMFAQFNWVKQTDTTGSCDAACSRGFTNPLRDLFPTGMFSYVHTFSPSVLNELRVGYTQFNQAIGTAIPGVPQINFDDGTAGFGSYSGYPQFFKDHIYTYSDVVSITHKNHNMKVGADFRRNIENSVFSVARPSYEMFDPLFFAMDAPAEEDAGVNPGICAPPCSSFNPAPQAALESNIRHWRNLEFGGYFQDDWKATKRLTLNLGLRYDLFTRHNELDNLATTFIPGPGETKTDILTGVLSANNPANCPGGPLVVDPLAQLVGECGPGGFAPAKVLGKPDHNNFGPRVGFAWDVFGNGKTALRGGFSVSYEGTLYNPLSNSRWNLPYYSFNFADNFINGDVNTIIYGPETCTSTSCSPSGATPTFTGPPTNPGQGIGAQATGNLTGWAPFNPNVAILTGIVLPEGIKDPYVYGYHFGVQHEIMPKMVLEVNYVGTTGHKLFRSENINRYPGSVLPVETDAGGNIIARACVTDNFGRNDCGNGGFANNNYGNLRNWRNVVNSNYNSLQTSVKKQMSHGLLFNLDYTYSHAIDNGSTWHSGATTANGAAAGEGYTTDQTLPGLDRGNALFDIRHRLTFNYVWQLPGQNMHGFAGAVLGGWSYNGVWALQSGPHWEPYISTAARLSPQCSVFPFVAANCTNSGGDYNLDHGRNDRPESTITSIVPSRSQWSNGWGPSAVASTFSAPCLGCTSNLGRNTFVGPGYFGADMTLAKNFKFTERVNLEFQAQGFNVFNRANFILATAGGGAHNKITDGAFGQAAGTLNARNLQLGLKLKF